LSIVRRIDRLLGLDLRLESHPGRGTKFILRVPRAPALVEARGVHDDSERALSGDFARPLDLRVWILDDEQSVRDALGTQLEAWGCAASSADSEAALYALRDAEGRWPDALIADDMLGGGRSGLDIARTCSEHFDSGRILMMTGGTLPERVAAIRAAGFHLMSKPAKPEELYARLSEIVMKRR
jgi:CheY-like chemotaxis protein